MRSPIALACLVGALAFSFAVPQAPAQSLWGVDGAAVTATQTTGPPAGLCKWPNGPITGIFNYGGGWPFCPTAGGFPPVAAVGDITVDMFTDTVWVTDGQWVTEYTKAGTILRSFPNPLPAPLSGLGWSADPTGLIAGVLWLTDGVAICAVAPPPPPCGLPLFVIQPFLASPAVPPPLTDVDFDPISGTLFVSSAGGVVGNLLIGGAVGPFGIIFPPCVGGYLDGIAVDRGNGNRLFVTDGQMIDYMDFFGVPATPTFYATAPCFPWAGSTPISGLAFDAAPISYGKSCDPSGVTPPTAGAVGEAVSPNPAFGLTITSAAPGGGGWLMMGVAPLCPPAPFWGCPLVVTPITLTGPFPIPLTGNLTIPVGIPPGLGSVGGTVFLQWIIAKPLGGFQTTQGLELTLSTP